MGFTSDFAVELSDFRMTLELNAVSHLAALPEDHAIWPRLAKLETEHRQLAGELDARFHDFSLLDERFHTAIGSVVQNRFVDELQKIIALVFHYHYRWDKKDERERYEAAINEHLRLIDALKRCNEADALAAARDHLCRSKQTLLLSLQSNAPA